MKIQTKIINFNQLDLEGNVFTKDIKFYFPQHLKIIKKDDGLYIERENNDNNVFYNSSTSFNLNRIKNK